MQEDEDTVQTRSSAARRRLVGASLVTAAAAIGIALGLVVPMLMAPRTAAQLHPVTGAGDARSFEALDLPTEIQVRYEDFRDMQVSSGRREGTLCLYVAFGEGWGDIGCTPGELEPTVDIAVGTEMAEIGILDLPIGSLVRFVLRDGAVDVWVVAAAGSETLGP